MPEQFNSATTIAEFEADRERISLELTQPLAEPPDAIRTAQRFLHSAINSVQNALNAELAMRYLRRSAQDQSYRGQLAQSDQDLLRSALIFAGAGLDQSMKQLLADCLAPLVRTEGAPRKGFKRFAERYLEDREHLVSAPALVGIMLSDADSPRDVLVQLYIKDRIDGSMQSCTRMHECLGALGLGDHLIRQRIGQDHSETVLDQMFRARNQMVHELDLSETDIPGHFGDKRNRARSHMVDWATEALDVSQIVINATGEAVAGLD